MRQRQKEKMNALASAESFCDTLNYEYIKERVFHANLQNTIADEMLALRKHNEEMTKIFFLYSDSFHMGKIQFLRIEWANPLRK